MSPNRRADREGGAQLDAWRTLLSEWEVPAVPPELEADLRRTFRQRHAGRRQMWLPLAAALVVGVAALTAWQMGRRDRTAPSGPVEIPRPSATPAALPEPPPSPDRLAHDTAETAPILPRPRRARSRGREDMVIVEPGQRELLAALAANLADPQLPSSVLSGAPVDVMRAGAPEAPIPRLVPMEPPRYRSDWERVAGAWPVLQLPTPTIQR